MVAHFKSSGPGREARLASPITFRVFLASPGDVRDERNLARQAIEQVRLERAFRGRLNLECFAWDQPGVAVAMDAGLTPQEAIARGFPKPSECDLVVVIFWSRMGTPLPPEYVKPDGTRYLSGTEWEYQDALGVARRSGRPAIWLYRRTKTPQLLLTDDRLDEKRAQWQLVDAFFGGFVGNDRSLIGGVNSYETADDFRRQFELHLRDHLYAVLEPLMRVEAPGTDSQTDSWSDVESPETALWTDAPYPGLEAFKPEQAPIFFGRGMEVDQLLELLRAPETRFIAVVGASGSGKSSLVAAGLIPRLRAGALPGSSNWVDITFKPGERGNDPFLALAYALKSALGSTGQREEDLARELQSEAGRFETCVADLLARRPKTAEFLLVVDQMEEVFSLVAAERRDAFLALLDAMVKTERVRVVVTLRRDFLSAALDLPALAGVLGGRGFFPVSAPGPLALAEMILRPARMAGIEIKQDLCKRILEDTGTGPGALALMAFTLNELYRLAGGSPEITLDHYKTLGGVSAAIEVQAERAVKEHLHGGDGALQALFRDLVGVNDEGVATRRRTHLHDIRGRDPAKVRLVESLVKARILVADDERREEAGGQVDRGESALSDMAVVEVAHEAVLSAWGRLADWVHANDRQLQVCREMTRAAKSWHREGKPPFRYLPDRAALKQYRKVPGECLSREDEVLVQPFMCAAGRRQWLWRGFFAGVLLLVTFLGVHIWLQNKRANWNILRIWTMARVGLYQGPRMERIPAGEFIMGGSAAECDKNPESEECPRHSVAISSFYIGKYEITIDEYSAYLLDKGKDLPREKPGGTWWSCPFPVPEVSWDDAQSYCQWVSERTGAKFRLPTEAEWEYAARGRSDKEYWWGDNPREEGKVWANCANCGSEFDGKGPAPVGSFPPNGYRLHDMHGNVREWCEDWYAPDYYLNSPEKDPSGPEAGTYRVVRGGGWSNDAGNCRSAYRLNNRPPGLRVPYVGFRLSRSVALGP